MPANKGEGKLRKLGPILEETEGHKQHEYERKLRRKVEDRLRKDRQAVLLIAKILEIE
jgi:hypothetical protein